ncbi:MAG: hypothetical protein J7599_22040 [Niabella sp.]|nr:hypothetical protein [Niabella sp.]
MKKYLNATVLLLVLIMAGACSKKVREKTETSNTFASIKDIPDNLFTGGELYGIWKIDSLKTLSGHYYKGEGTVQLAFTNDGNMMVENPGQIALKHVESFAPDWKIHPWYFMSGIQRYEMKWLQPGNEIAVEEGYPYTAAFAFAGNREQWTGHFSGKKIWLYQWASGNAQVHIWAKKIE